MKGTYRITYDCLKELGACDTGLKLFAERYPDGGEYQEILDRCCSENRANYAEWLLYKIGATEDERIYEEEITDPSRSIVFAGRIVFKQGAVVKSLFAGKSIEAGEGIKARWGIEAGCGIKAGEGIEAGEGYGVFAGLAIKLSLWDEYAIVTAKNKPNNLISGHWVEKETEQ